MEFIDKVIGSADVWGPIAGAGLGTVFLLIAVIKNLLYVCPPNEVLIFSGRSRTMEDGRTVGFRVVAGGRAFRVPILEKIDRMDMTNISVPMAVNGAYSKGADDNLGIPLTLHAVANVKVSSNPKYIGNAIERFLGKGRDEIARVAKETMEGHLRGVLATLTPEEVNEDRLKFAETLLEEAEPDLVKFGLSLDTLKIQHVGDERNYLESLGRKPIAEAIRAAEIAESDAERTARESEADAMARAEVAQTHAQAAVLKKQNELRQLEAELDAQARSAEERAIAAAAAARAEAEKELQTIRGQLEGLRLQADITIPAEIGRRVREFDAAGNAATIAWDGKAQAMALEEVSKAWAESGGKAMDMYVLQNLDGIFNQVTSAASKLKVREVNLVDSGSGSTLPAYVGAYPATVAALLGQVQTAIGVDIKRIITGHGDSSQPETLPAGPTAQSENDGGQAW